MRALQHDVLAALLKREYDEWANSLAHMPKRSQLFCPLCGKSLWWVPHPVRHVLTHNIGRLSFQLRVDKSGGSARYPIHMEVMHAFYDSDVLAGKVLGGYGRRTADLLASWLAPADSEGAGSTYTWLGKDDSAVALVFARDGPQYWRKDFIAGLSCLKMFGNHGYYTIDFANMYARHLLRNGGVVAITQRGIAGGLRAKGCETVSMLNRHPSDAALMAGEILEPAGMTRFLWVNTERLFELGEAQSISVDPTYTLSTRQPYVHCSTMCSRCC